MRQLITCASDNFIYVWDLANEESREGGGGSSRDVGGGAVGGDGTAGARHWEKLKAQSTTLTVSYGSEKSWSPAIGKYKFLNKVWKPVHKICFLDPHPQLSAVNQHAGHGAGGTNINTDVTLKVKSPKVPREITFERTLEKISV